MLGPVVIFWPPIFKPSVGFDLTEDVHASSSLEGNALALPGHGLSSRFYNLSLGLKMAGVILLLQGSDMYGRIQCL